MTGILERGNVERGNDQSVSAAPARFYSLLSPAATEEEAIFNLAAWPLEIAKFLLHLFRPVDMVNGCRGSAGNISEPISSCRCWLRNREV
jgi:hypothetical protein